MTDTSTLLLATLVAVQAIGTVTYLILISRLFSTLERKHPAVYESLGSPSLLLNNNLHNNALIFGWLWRNEFEALGDSGTIATARRIRAFLLPLLVNFIALLFVLFSWAAPLGAWAF